MHICTSWTSLCSHQAHKEPEHVDLAHLGWWILKALCLFVGTRQIIPKAHYHSKWVPFSFPLTQNNPYITPIYPMCGTKQPFASISPRHPRSFHVPQLIVSQVPTVTNSKQAAGYQSAIQVFRFKSYALSDSCGILRITSAFTFETV